MKCPVCNTKTDDLSYSLELEIMNMIKRDNPQWVESDGSCGQCTKYYESLDTIVEVIE
jgi:hypothetical protein